MRTILIGLGNPILGDDACGWRVVDRVEQQLQHKPQEVWQEIDSICLSIGGLGLMEHLIGYDRAIIVDAVSTGKAAPGTVSLQALEEMPDLSAGHTTSVHDTSLQNSVRLARIMGINLPGTIIVVGIETHTSYTFTEGLTEAVAEAVPQAVQIINELLSAQKG